MVTACRTRSHFRQRGVTLVELALVVALVSIMAAIAMPTYSRIMENQRVSQAISEIAKMNLMINRARTPNGQVPDSIAGLQGMPAADPWGEPYEYVSFSAPGFDHNDSRKDGNLKPINTEFDLFSKGKNKDFRRALNAGPSRDDVVMAHDGAFIGKAEDF